VIDTATPYLYVALVDGTTVVERYYQEGKNNHSVKLMQEIQDQFQRAKWTIRDLDDIIVGIGPGSYTGLRIGVVVAKMLGWNSGIPVKTVSSLALLASSVTTRNWILPAMDARRGDAFLGVYQRTGEGLVLVQKEELAHLATYRQNLPEHVLVEHGEPDIGLILDSDLLSDVPDIHALAPNYLRKTKAEQDKERS
jgi:tRNA threonylcarbamoyladenosine biosynthesis protein TsaB